MIQRLIVLSLFVTLGAVATADEAVEDFSLHTQVTSVTQQHASFRSPNPPYPGPNSMASGFDEQTSLTWTFFIGRRLWHGAELYFDPEMSGGSGFNKTTGMAAFPNAEIYRVDDPNPKWNLARLYIKQVFALGDAYENVPADLGQLAGPVPVRRLTVVVGKFALNDYFDNNSFSHDPRTQFLNWALMDQAAWDYAADTRGYSVGFYVEWNERNWSVRYASVEEPAQANQMQMDSDWHDAHGDNLEFEYRYKVADQPGTVRVLGYQNHAQMGNYQQALAMSGTPDITATRAKGRLKTGFGLNAEQSITPSVGVFGRFGWDDGHTETWAFTECDESLSAGVNVKGSLWQRPDDNAGAAFIYDMLSTDHRAYLARGGVGFIIGDGQLNYAPEQVAELYYLWQVQKTLGLSGDYQYVINPAYNQDRGPINILSLRVHFEI